MFDIETKNSLSFRFNLNSALFSVRALKKLTYNFFLDIKFKHKDK